jgi:hypothetical protein
MFSTELPYKCFRQEREVVRREDSGRFCISSVEAYQMVDALQSAAGAFSMRKAEEDWLRETMGPEGPMLPRFSPLNR